MAKKNDAEYIASRCYELAEEKKAEDLIWLDVRDESSICDYFVICSGLSEPHLRALADHISNELAKEKIRAKGIDGFPSSQWVIMDYVDVLVHIFLKEKRQFYGLEQLWGRTQRVR